MILLISPGRMFGGFSRSMRFRVDFCEVNVSVDGPEHCTHSSEYDEGDEPGGEVDTSHIRGGSWCQSSLVDDVVTGWWGHARPLDVGHITVRYVLSQQPLEKCEAVMA